MSTLYFAPSDFSSKELKSMISSNSSNLFNSSRKRKFREEDEEEVYDDEKEFSARYSTKYSPTSPSYDPGEGETGKVVQEDEDEEASEHYSPGAKYSPTSPTYDSDSDDEPYDPTEPAYDPEKRRKVREAVQEGDESSEHYSPPTSPASPMYDSDEEPYDPTEPAYDPEKRRKVREAVQDEVQEDEVQEDDDASTHYSPTSPAYAEYWDQ